MKIKALFTIGFAAVVLSSCSNFLQGEQIIDQLNESIEIAQENSTTITVVKYNPNGFISLSPEGTGQYKRKQEFTIEANIKSDYRFVEWRIVDKRNGILAENADEFLVLSNQTLTETANGSIATVDVKVIKQTDVDFLQIVPVCSVKNDTKAPDFAGNFVCANSLENLSTNKSIENNSRINATRIYIKTDAVDEDKPDGFYIKETLISTDKNVTLNADNVKESIVTEVFTETKLNVYSCEFEYELQTKANGFIQLDIQLIDAAGNRNAEIKTYKFFNDTYADISSMFIYSRHSGWDNEIPGFTMAKEKEAAKTIFWSQADDTKICNDKTWSDEIKDYSVSWGYSEDEISGSVSTKDGVIHCQDATAYLIDNNETIIGKEFFYTLPDSVFEPNKNIYVTVTAYDCAGNSDSYSNVILAKPEILSIIKFLENDTAKYRYNISNISSDRFEDTKGYDQLGYKIFAEDPETGRVLILSDEDVYTNMSYNSQFSEIHTWYTLDGNWSYVPDLSELHKYKLYIQPVYLRPKGQTKVKFEDYSNSIFNEFLTIRNPYQYLEQRESVVYGQLGEFNGANIEDLNNLQSDINTDCIESVNYSKGKLNSWRINVEMTLKDNIPTCKTWLCKVTAGSSSVTINNIQCTNGKTLTFEIGDWVSFFEGPNIFTLTGFDENGKVLIHSIYNSTVENNYELDTCNPYAYVKYVPDENEFYIELCGQDPVCPSSEDSEGSIEYCIFPYDKVSSLEQVTSELLEEYQVKTIKGKFNGSFSEITHKLPLSNFEKNTSYSIYVNVTDQAGNFRSFVYSFAISEPPVWSQPQSFSSYTFYDSFNMIRNTYIYEDLNFVYISTTAYLEPVNYTNCDIAMAFENSKGFKIEYDQKCIVQTYYSKKNLGSNLSDWLLNGTECNTVVYDPENPDAYNCSYYYNKKPSEISIEWDETYYYVTVCVFSDRTKCISSVKEWHFEDNFN